MNNQEAFNKVWQHFVVNESPRSIDSGLSCCYRSGDGNKCAVGCLISDELYDDVMEGNTVKTLMITNLGYFGVNAPKIELLREYFREVDVGLLRRVQSIHDSEWLFKEFERHMRKVAEDYKLTIPR